MLEQFQKMPRGMQILMAVLGGSSLLSIAAMIDARTFVIVLIGLALVVLAVFVWKLFQNWKAREHAKALKGQLSTHSSASPTAISDPARRAKLDDLRQNFTRGLEKFASAGKDLYSLPWYVICGEPGSGKTEAVRHCNVGFPPGLQDEMQGAGGTINMHWWFTNHAVLIDTAGKLLFEEAPPGTTTEWSEFLKLLRKSRPDCPINGLLLVIPSESLIRDSFEEINRKAGKIAQQLDTIQRTLDVRFPVFVLITKCDLINGFREFFTGVKDPQLQHQMTGWSNPDSLDTGFRPEAVDQHLAEVVQRISRRRLGLLRDPVAADAGKRRADEVDALFALPASIAALAARLRKYLETIFVAGEWSAKPLFLRGIYFTSALTEGAALDAELATVLGVPVDQLPEGKAWERERSYFLRDLFVQKIFKERGLVTRASNTGKLIRRRQQIIGGVCAAGMLVLIAVSFLGQRALKSSVRRELAYWQAAANDWSGARWHPIVNSGLEYTGNDIVRLDNGETMSIIDFQEKLQQRVSTNLQIPWVFKPVESVAVRANPGRRRAQRVIFEASVIAPLLDANRDRLVNATNWTPADADRLAALVELEGAIHLKDLPGYDADYPAEDFFTPLLGPSLAGVTHGSAIMNRLTRIFDWTYFRGGDGRGQWPEAWFSRGKTLRDNQPLLRGWDALDRSMQASGNAQHDALEAIQAGRLVVIRYREAEKAFLRAAAQPRSSPGWEDGVIASWHELAPRRADLDKLVDDLRHKTGVTGAVTLDSSYRTTVERMRAEAVRASQRVRAVLAKQKAAADAAAQATSGPASEFTLYRDLERRLAGLNTMITDQLDQLLPATEQAQLADLDADTLRPWSGGVPSYVARCDDYATCMGVLAPAYAAGTLFGRLAEVVGHQSTALAALRDRVPKYDGPLEPDYHAAMKVLLDSASVTGVEATLGAYRRELDRVLPETLGYPLGSGPALTAEQLQTATAVLQKVRADIAATGVPPETRQTLESRFSRIGRMAAFASQLTDADGNPVMVKVQLLRERDQAQAVEQALGVAATRRLALTRVYPSMRIGDRDVRARGLLDNLELQKLSIAAPLPRLEFYTTPDPKPEPDAQFDPGLKWGVLHLLQQGAVRHADGKDWDAVVRLNDRGTELVLALNMVFDRPLPPLDRWPAPAQ